MTTNINYKDLAPNNNRHSEYNEISKRALDIKITSQRRYCDVIASHRRRHFDVMCLLELNISIKTVATTAELVKVNWCTCLFYFPPFLQIGTISVTFSLLSWTNKSSLLEKNFLI